MALKLNRRAFLRGIGAGLALPALECMLNDRGLFHWVAQAADVAPPVRFLGVMNHNGYNEQLWAPAVRSPTDFTLPSSMQSLANYKMDSNFLYGLQGNALYQGFHHLDGQLGFWTGFPRQIIKPSDGATSNSFATSASVEQILGQKLGFGKTAFPSLALSLPKGHCDRMYPWNQTSWVGNNQKADIIDNPADLASKLIGQAMTATTAPAASAATQQQKSVLDFYLNESNRLASKLGAVDKARLDQHLSAVRDIENQISVVRAACAPFTTPISGGAVGDTDFSKDDLYMPLMAKLVTFAFQCDLTRYVLFNIANAPPQFGSTNHMDDHDSSHEDNLLQPQWQRNNLAYMGLRMQYYAMFLEGMKASPEAGNTILYNSVCLLGNDIGGSTPHSLENFKLVQSGQAGGRIDTGRYLTYPGAPLNNLWASLLTASGLATDKFGADGTGKLTGFLKA